MKGFHSPIEKDTRENSDFRRVLYTGAHAQLVLMCLAHGEDIGFEVHEETDQFFRVESGEGKVIIDDTEYAVKDGDAIIVPAGARHNVVNVGTEDLKLYTLYAPPHHKDGTVRATKARAAADSPEFDGTTTE